MLGSESITLAFVHTRPWTGRDAGRSSSRSCRRQLAPHPEGLTLGLCLLGPGPCSKRRPDAGPGRLSEGRQGFLCASCLNSRRSAGEQGEEARWHGSHCSKEARRPLRRWGNQGTRCQNAWLIRFPPAPQGAAEAAPCPTRWQLCTWALAAGGLGMGSRVPGAHPPSLCDPGVEESQAPGGQGWRGQGPWPHHRNPGHLALRTCNNI